MSAVQTELLLPSATAGVAGAAQVPWAGDTGGSGRRVLRSNVISGPTTSEGRRRAQEHRDGLKRVAAKSAGREARKRQKKMVAAGATISRMLLDRLQFAKVKAELVVESCRVLCTHISEHGLPLVAEWPDRGAGLLRIRSSYLMTSPIPVWEMVVNRYDGDVKIIHCGRPHVMDARSVLDAGSEALLIR